MTPSDDKLHELFNRMLDDEFREDDQALLDESLKGNTDAQAAYVDLLILDELLRAEFPAVGAGMSAAGLWEAATGGLAQFAESSEQIVPVPFADDVPTSPTVELASVGRTARAIDLRRHPIRFALASLAIVAVFWTFWANLIRVGRDDLLNRPTGEAAVVAILQSADDCQWASLEEPSAPGDALKAGQLLDLTRGIAEIELEKGARVVLQGPVRFEVRSANEGYLHQGKLVAHVPPKATGFTMETPSARVVDLGTEFGLDVSKSGDTVVHVLRGKVETTQLAADGSPSATDKPQRLGAGSAIRIPADAAPISLLQADTKSFESLLAHPDLRQEVGDPKVMAIPLGNLFDDRPPISLKDALATDAYMAAADNRSLGIDSVQLGGAAVKQISPQVSFDMTNLGWSGKSYKPPANDVYAHDNRTKNKDWSIRTRGIVGPLTSEKAEDGIGQHPDSALTFNLDKIRSAGSLADQALQFVCDRAGINDDMLGNPTPAVHMLVLVSSETDVLRAYVNGGYVEVVKVDGVWKLARKDESPLITNGRFARFRMALPAEAKYLTLAVAGAANNRDPISGCHAVWSGARLEVVIPQRTNDKP